MARGSEVAVENVVLIVLVAGMAAGWWWLNRRRRQLTGDPDAAGPDADTAPPEVFSRDTLLNRQRSFDPAGWDDSADAGQAAPGPTPATGEDLPTYFDRDYLTRRSDQPAGVWPEETDPDEPEEEPRFLDREYLERKAKHSGAEPAEPED
ncbi:MAG: hypothetical protein AAGC63_16340 [Propionicimonas sp.]|nr:hypothetical protein [Propionicimonas sp.]